MRAQLIIRDFRNIGILAATAWAVSALLSLIASLCLYCDASSHVIDEYAPMLAIVGALGLGFAVGSYAIPRALGEIAAGLATEIASEDARRKYLS